MRIRTSEETKREDGRVTEYHVNVWLGENEEEGLEDLIEDVRELLRNEIEG